MPHWRYATIKIYITFLFCQHKGKKLIKDYTIFGKGGDVYAVRNFTNTSNSVTSISI